MGVGETSHLGGLTMNAIRDIVQRVFGPLTPNTHTYYGKVAGEV